MIKSNVPLASNESAEVAVATIWVSVLEAMFKSVSTPLPLSLTVVASENPEPVIVT